MRKAFCTATILSLLICSGAAAQRGTGAFRLGVDLRPFSLLHYPNDGQAFVQFAVFGLDSFLLSRQQVTLSGAVQPFDIPLVLGSRVGMGYGQITFAGLANAIEGGTIALVPFLEYLFLEGDVRPFLGGQVGFQISFLERIGLGGGGGGIDTNALFVTGGMGGVHLFPIDSFSISPQLEIDFIYNGQTQRAGAQLVLSVTLAGWMFGEEARPRPHSAPPPEPQTPPPPPATDEAPADSLSTP
jgi:hypothetical protein